MQHAVSVDRDPHLPLPFLGRCVCGRHVRAASPADVHAFFRGLVCRVAYAPYRG